MPAITLTGEQLSKEDEQAGNEVEVRREDQDKINKFSRLHQRELAIEEELKLKNVRTLAGKLPSHAPTRHLIHTPIPERERGAGRSVDRTGARRRR